MAAILSGFLFQISAPTIAQDKPFHFYFQIAEKRQTAHQQKQAAHAISLFYEIELSDSGIKTVSLKKDVSSIRQPSHVKSTGSDWTAVYNELNSEIKIRHYSPKTLKAYTGWIKQLQNFIKSKDPQLLCATDVKEFLTFLAVKRKVSASSLN